MTTTPPPKHSPTRGREDPARTQKRLRISGYVLSAVVAVGVVVLIWWWWFRP